MTRPGASEAQAIAWEEDEQQRMVPATTGAVGTQELARLSQRFSARPTSARTLSLISAPTSLPSAWTPTHLIDSLMSSLDASTSHAAQSHSQKTSTSPLSDGHTLPRSTQRDTNFNNRISALFRVFNPRSRRSARIIDATELDSRAVDADVGPVTASEDHDNIPPECPVACFSPSACSCVIALDGSCTPAPPQSWRLPISLPQHEVCGQDEDARSDGPVESPVPRSDFVSTPLSTTSAGEDDVTPSAPHDAPSERVPSPSRFPILALVEHSAPTSHRRDKSHQWCTWKCGCLLDQDVPHECYLRPPSPFWNTSPLLRPRMTLPSAESELTITVDFDLLADMPALSLNSASTASSSDTESPEHLGTQPVTPRSPRKRPDMHLKIVPRSMLSTLSPTLLSPTPLSPGSFDPYPERPDEECEGWPRISVYGRPAGFGYSDVASPRTPGFDLKITRS